jgi:multidrug efflux pump subunit AcrA (membrane-fusion protein)
VEAANAAVEKANADVKEKAAGVLAAKADVALKRSLVHVARLDYERSIALADFARIRAPFDGVVVQRNVDPGSFVQNATTGASEPLISVARTDIVTVSAKFPDNQAMLIGRKTPAIVELDDLPNAAIPASVTRYSPSIRNNDRTMTVEVDLFNGTPTEFKQLAARTVATGLAPLGAATPIGFAIVRTAVNDYFIYHRKSSNDSLPGPAFNDELALHSKLLPGMTGILRLQLSRFGKSYAIPSSAIYTRGGKPYILLVQRGVTHQTPIHIHVDDGSSAKVSVVAKISDRHGTHEVLRELTGAEEIVASRQLEVGDGREVQTAPSEW